MAVILLRDRFVRVMVLKGTSIATDAGNLDGFRVGETRDVPARIAIPLTAAGWVRPVVDRKTPRRGFSDDPHSPDRRLLTDRRTGEVS